MKIDKFYKVIVIKIDVFQSDIIDERHFGNVKEAKCFISNLRNTPYVGVLVEL